METVESFKTRKRILNATYILIHFLKQTVSYKNTNY